MRAVLLAIVVAVGPAGADPKKLPKDTVPEGTPPVQVKLPDIAKHLPAFGGGTATGIVIDPGYHPDALPWPLGMVITPPDPHDPMVITPGTDRMPGRLQSGSRTLGRRTLDLLNDGLDTLTFLLRPHT